jgi:hypothetical protein
MLEGQQVEYNVRSVIQSPSRVLSATPSPLLGQERGSNGTRGWLLATRCGYTTCLQLVLRSGATRDSIAPYDYMHNHMHPAYMACMLLEKHLEYTSVLRCELNPGSPGGSKTIHCLYGQILAVWCLLFFNAGARALHISPPHLGSALV